MYGSVADQVYQDITNHSAPAAPVEEVEPGPDPTSLFEAARAKFFQEGQKVRWSQHTCPHTNTPPAPLIHRRVVFNPSGSGRAAGREEGGGGDLRERAGPQPDPRQPGAAAPRPRAQLLRQHATQAPRPAAHAARRHRGPAARHHAAWRVRPSR